VHRAASRLATLDPPNSAGADDPAPAAERDPREWDRLLRACRNDLQATGAALDDVSREIRVGLTVIKGRAQLLRRQAFATGAPDRRLVHAVDEIDRAVGQIEQVLRGRLLDLEPGGGYSRPRAPNDGGAAPRRTPAAAAGGGPPG
jgi:signal transduction histidine kinase